MNSIQPFVKFQDDDNNLWLQHFHRLANKALGAETAQILFNKYQTLFTDTYQSLLTPRNALQDLLSLQQLDTQNTSQVSLICPSKGFDYYRLHFYCLQPRYLDEFLPVLANIGLRVMDQVQFQLTIENSTLFIKSFAIKAAKQQYTSFKKLRSPLLANIQAVMSGKMENDGLNKLTVLSAMDWQAIDLLRAYRNYFLQINHHTTRNSIHHALINNPVVALCLYQYFEIRFRPEPKWSHCLQREEQALTPLREQLLINLKDVNDINEDRILRTLFNLIDATTRSNFHLRRDHSDFFIAFKINSLGVIDMPSPKPQFEVYVHAVNMEGIHLRAGNIARGGIRWSDRQDDFRTEILGLMQTQVSKNALIIPTGAKGGFIVKKYPNPEDTLGTAKSSYQTLMHGLLDLTDNLPENKPEFSSQIVCYDNPDPYLVVAADKGTASFSDLANQVSAEYQFWLADAFASGGSRGYDHKALGITARGAWECVKRHFLELGKDIQNEAFTIIGIGSMDGDVFGNGMLLSPYGRLLAAFSGQHIFIDPNPPEDDSAFKERQRLFTLPHSSWNDYDRNLISEGGGVYLRSEKDIPLSDTIKKWLDIRYQSLDGETLIKCLLCAPVDLLWLGGIGTYVKSSIEKQEEVGDRNNDNVRINANQLKALVVGEGANLGFTQKARIEFALAGGSINTDAIDNSAGVDTSDHEVNLKILLMQLQQQQLIDDYQPLFTGMTSEVCQLVLNNNIAQSRCLSLEQRRCQEDLSIFLQLADRLEASGFLDRIVESFPENQEILTRAQPIITRPELAVLIAAAKRYLTQKIQDEVTSLHHDCCHSYLEAYFPQPLVERFKNQLSQHPLANQIKATIISNKIINQAGCNFLMLDVDKDHHHLLDQVRCYLAFDRIIDGDALRQDLEQLENKASINALYLLLLQLEKTLSELCRWSLVHHLKINTQQQTINQYRDYLQQYKELTANHNKTEFTDALADKIQLIASLNDFPLLVALAKQNNQDFTQLATIYQELNRFLGLDTLYERLAKLPVQSVWERKLLVDLPDTLKQITSRILSSVLTNAVDSCADYFELPEMKQKAVHYKHIYQELSNAPAFNLLPYLVFAKEFERLFSDSVEI